MDAAQATLKALEGGPAVFSEDRVYRYTLTRVWDESLPTACWIMLNPSTADENRLDPTLRRVLRFSHDWGYGGFTVVNVFAFRATDPLGMKRATDPVGPGNDGHIIVEALKAGIVVAGWGAHAKHRNRSTEVRRLLWVSSVRLNYLKLTKAGEPCHPLYLSSELKPIPFEESPFDA